MGGGADNGVSDSMGSIDPGVNADGSGRQDHIYRRQSSANTYLTSQHRDISRSSVGVVAKTSCSTTLEVRRKGKVRVSVVSPRQTKDSMEDNRSLSD